MVACTVKQVFQQDAFSTEDNSVMSWLNCEIQQTLISFLLCSTVLFADPTDEEENLVTGIVTVVITDDDKIAAVHKPGNMCFGDLTILGQAKKILLPFNSNHFVS